MQLRFTSIVLLCGLLAMEGVNADPIDLSNPFNILNQQRLAGEFLGYRPKAETNGVVLSLQSVSDLLGNTKGGEMEGGTYSGLLNLGLAIDLQKAVGWEGASFKNTWLWLYGNDVSSKFIGNSLTASSIAGQPAFRCYELWLQQNLLHDAVSLRGGLIPVDTEFMVSDTANLFVNSTFGPPAVFTMNIPNGGPTYPMATLDFAWRFSPPPGSPSEALSPRGIRFPSRIINTASIGTSVRPEDFSISTKLKPTGARMPHRKDCPATPRLVSGSRPDRGRREERSSSISDPQAPAPTTTASTPSSTRSSLSFRKKPLLLPKRMSLLARTL